MTSFALPPVGGVDRRNHDRSAPVTGVTVNAPGGVSLCKKLKYNGKIHGAESGRFFDPGIQGRDRGPPLRAPPRRHCATQDTRVRDNGGAWGDISNPEPFGRLPAGRSGRPRGGNERSKIAVSEIMAEREGFEPSIRLPVYTRSRRAPSTTRPPLRRRRVRGRTGHPRSSSRYGGECQVVAAGKLVMAGRRPPRACADRARPARFCHDHARITAACPAWPGPPDVTFVCGD